MATNMNYRYKLDPGSTKFTCPGCGQRRFVRYIDTEINDYLSEKYGRCDREINCGYHRHPYSKELGYRSGRYCKTIRNTLKPKPCNPLYPIPIEVLQDTLQYYQKNQFVQNLLHNVLYPFNKEDIEMVIAQYYVGTIDRGAGRRRGTMRGYVTTFPFIDYHNNLRAIQAKQFDPRNHTYWTGFVHSIIESKCVRHGHPIPEWISRYKDNESKVSCLFGEHLLSKYPYNPVALVEAPKTAIIGTLYFGFPQEAHNMLWLATGSLGYLTYERCRRLAGRDVYLFPDLSLDGIAYRKWNKCAFELKNKLSGTRCTMSNLLEGSANEQDRFSGYDLADYLIQLDWRKFRHKEHSIQWEECENWESDII